MPAGAAAALPNDLNTFDCVESARRRLIQLVADSSVIPDREAVIAELASSCAHAWCFWLQPRPDRPALLISSEWNFSGFALLGLASSVEWWDTDGERAALLARVASELSSRLRVSHCMPQRLASQVAQLQEPLGLAALQGVFGPAPRASFGSQRGTLQHLRKLTAAQGQCCVISRNRFTMRNRGGQDSAPAYDGRRPTPGQVRRALALRRADPTGTIFFQPDHIRPSEILAPPNLLPAARRGSTWARLLGRTWILEKVLGSFACIAPSARDATLLHEMFRQLRPEVPPPTKITWRNSIVRDCSMLFLSASVETNAEVLLRVPLSQDAADALARADRTCRDLRATLPWLRRLIPAAEPLMHVRGWPAHLEQKCQGVAARTLVGNPSRRSILRRRVEEFAATLCGSTVRNVIADDAFATTHVIAKFKTIRVAAPELEPQLFALEAALLEKTRGRSLPTVRIHGDVNLGNLFFDPETLKLAGVIDWEASVSDSLPFDLLHYLLSEQQELQRRPWGSLLADELSRRAFDDEARGLLAAHLASIGLDEGLRASLLVAYWIRGVALRIERSGGTLAAHWQRHNLVEPLASIGEEFTRT
jgi:aminoglycoside phosphotransferase (APT) family kinase protein